MKILITLDYELFLGTKTGSVQRCLVEPMNRIIEAVDKLGVKFTLFVDATYLYKLSEYAVKYPELKKELNDILTHLNLLKENGHDIQLHIHPHWFFSFYNGNDWILDNEHYKLSDLTEEEANQIFKLSKDFLDKAIGKETFAFRAGGFSAQPTERLVSLCKKNSVCVDSSVYPGNYYKSLYQNYDYRICSNKSSYRFEEDICKEQSNGCMLEVPLTSYSLSPFFYWKLVATKLLKLDKHKVFSDGISVKTTGDSIKERLMKKTSGFATIDGYKVSYLYDAYKCQKRKSKDVFCVIGHPKLATPYSIGKLEQFCKKVADEADFITISSLL